MSQRLLLLLLALSFTTVYFSCNNSSGHRNTALNTITNPKDGYLNVTKIVDGDTFWVDNGTEKGLKIRLIGIDAPETRRTGKKEVGYYGKEATAYLTQLIAGKSVKLEYDVTKKDRYKRTLAYVYLQDGTFINAALVKNGYAVVMTVPPNVKYAEEFVKLQQEARENNRGLWANQYSNLH